MMLLTPGLQQSLLIQSQRRALDKIGVSVGTPVLYLKAAWADPVLYGGRGERTGGDLDVLVRPRLFRAFGAALADAGFRRYRDPGHVASHHLHGKAWLYEPPPDALPVDLHRDLADRPWFRVPVDEWIDRAHRYESCDGDVLSLMPEDQVLYAAAHYANHRFDLGPQHLNDIVRLLGLHPVNWQQIKERAVQSGLCVPLALLAKALRQHGVTAPLLANDPAFVAAWRIWYANRWIGPQGGLQRIGKASDIDMLLLMPALSDIPSALPRYMLRFAVARPLDCFEKVFFRCTRAATSRVAKV